MSVPNVTMHVSRLKKEKKRSKTKLLRKNDTLKFKSTNDIAFTLKCKFKCLPRH